MTPLTALKFAELTLKAGIPKGVINILPGSGKGYGWAHAHQGEPGLQAARDALGQNGACWVMGHPVQSQWDGRPDGDGGGPPVVSHTESAVDLIEDFLLLLSKFLSFSIFTMII